MSSQVWDEITYTFPDFMIDVISIVGLKLSHANNWENSYHQLKLFIYVN